MKYLTYLLSALLLVFAAGCNDTEEPLGDPVPPFTLKADRFLNAFKELVR